MSVSILGYSERGMITAICADIDREDGGLEAVEQLLALIAFPLAKRPVPVWTGLQAVEILIEQSFSDFGTPDIIFLIRDRNGDPHCVSIEAKVHTFGTPNKGIEERWNRFERFLKNKKRGSSGLFWQMFRQQQLARQLLDPKAEITSSSRPKKWKLGNNAVVKEAVKKVHPYAKSFWSVALLPEPDQEIRDFYTGKVASHVADDDDLPAWNAEHWGYMTWRAIRKMAQQDSGRWSRTLRSFEWNKGQIDRD